MRLIDADALIAKWEEEAKHITEFAHPGMVYGIINDVKRQPTIEAPRWIPVTQQLPEIGEKVLVSTKYTVFTQVFKRIYGTPDRWGWEHNTIKNVTAWMPMPEPYQGGEQE